MMVQSSAHSFTGTANSASASEDARLLEVFSHEPTADEAPHKAAYRGE